MCPTPSVTPSEISSKKSCIRETLNLRANERPQQNLHEKGTEYTWTSRLYEIIGLRADSLKMVKISPKYNGVMIPFGPIIVVCYLIQYIVWQGISTQPF